MVVVKRCLCSGERLFSCLHFSTFFLPWKPTRCCMDPGSPGLGGAQGFPSPPQPRRRFGGSARRATTQSRPPPRALGAGGGAPA